MKGQSSTWPSHPAIPVRFVAIKGGEDLIDEKCCVRLTFDGSEFA